LKKSKCLLKMSIMMINLKIKTLLIVIMLIQKIYSIRIYHPINLNNNCNLNHNNKNNKYKILIHLKINKTLFKKELQLYKILHPCLKKNLFKNIQLMLMKIQKLNIKIMIHLIKDYKIKNQLLLAKKISNMKIINNKNNNFKNLKMNNLKVK